MAGTFSQLIPTIDPPAQSPRAGGGYRHLPQKAKALQAPKKDGLL